MLKITPLPLPGWVVILYIANSDARRILQDLCILRVRHTQVVLPLTPLTHAWRKSKDLYHLVLLYNIHFKIIRVMFTYLSNGYVLVNTTRCIITREECEEIKANLI